ncbi:N-6 DNA methylase [Pseudomonas sp. A006]|nr:Type I restriction enzyme EcoKI M protein [Pseudomonas fluorescens]MBW9246280.1 N-6 DNA methylase [Pseudomonas paracarnis]
MNTENHSQTAEFLWSITELLRGDFRHSDYGRIILPFTLLRRMECVLAPTKDAVVREFYSQEGRPDTVRDMNMLRAAGGQQFFNASPLTLGTLSDTQTASDLMSYIQAFSKDAREIFEHFHFEDFVQQLESASLLYQVVQRFAATDLSPHLISNFGMGIIFEELIRKFAESSNEIAGEHFTPHDIVQLTTSLVITENEYKKEHVHHLKLAPSSIVTIYDPTAGTGGFLSEGDEYIQSISDKVSVSLHGQELNPESYAICKANMLIKGQDLASIKLGNTLFIDQLAGKHFDFMLSNPPFGVGWKKVQKQITDEHSHKGFKGRFGPGLPRVSDGSLLFLLHMVSKMRAPSEGGSRVGIILNGSPLFTGGAGSGESEIRRYLLQNDLVETVVALPTDMFYNTGITAYILVLSNHKNAVRRGKVQIIDATAIYAILQKSLGSKRKHLSPEQIAEITRLHDAFEEGPNSKILLNTDLGYRRITFERPLRLTFSVNAEKLAAYRVLKGADQAELFAKVEGRFNSLPNFLLEAGIKKLSISYKKAVITCFGERDSNAEPLLGNSGELVADISMRKAVNIPLNQSAEDYFEREIKPYTKDSWISHSSVDSGDGKLGIVGYDINVHRLRVQSQIERLESQYKSYFSSSLGRLALVIIEGKEDERFTHRENSIYVKKIGGPNVTSSLDDYSHSHKNYIQIVIGRDAIADYVVAFFQSELGSLSLEASAKGAASKYLTVDDLYRIAVALPTLSEQQDIVTTLGKLRLLKHAIKNLDGELALNPTSSNSLQHKIDGMLEAVGRLTDEEKVRNIIRAGETGKAEFKSSFSIDIKKQEKAGYIEDASLKTVVAFLNTNGGVLLIGISDDGEALGLNEEITRFHKGSNDKFLLYWKNNLKSRIGEQYYPFISAQLVSLSGKKILWVACSSSLTPCYLDSRDFYVRTNPATDKLEGPKLVEYVNNHFAK